TGKEHHKNREDRAEPWDVHAEPVLGPEHLRQKQQRAVEKIEDDLQHPEGDDQRDPDQQAGDEVLFHVIETKKPGSRRAGQDRCAIQSVVAGADFFFASGFASVLASVFASPFRSAFLSTGLLPALLKSVAYQPLPFSWKPAALRSFLYAFWPQAGHLVS